MEITVAMDYGASMTIEMEREFPFCFFFFLFLLLTIPRLAFLFPSSKFDHLLPSLNDHQEVTSERFHARILKIVPKNVETYSIYARSYQVETKLKKKPDSWRNARIEINPLSNRRLIELQQAMYSFFENVRSSVLCRTEFLNVWTLPLQLLSLSLPEIFFIPLPFRTVTRPLSLSMQIFRPKPPGIKRGGERNGIL